MAFPARFNGICANCHKPIEVGQFIGWNRRGIKKTYHLDCQNVWAKPTETATIEDASEMTQDDMKQETIPVPVANAANVPSDMASNLIASIQAIAGNSVNAAKVKEIAESVFDTKKASFEDAILKLLVETKQPRELVIKREENGETTSVNVGHTHKSFELLLNVARSHSNETPINIWLTGPAGSGKTHAASQLAKSLGVKFAFSGAIMEPYSLLGYMDANGKLVRTAFREIYEFGGVFLQDEIDGSTANALLPFNAALANGHCAFPDMVIPRHKDCIIIAAANTFGLGGNSDYVGRVKLDAATLSRYVFIDWEYDETLERALCQNDKWCDRVISIRHKVKSLGLKLLVTPRATYTGARLLASGIPQSQVELMVLKQGMTNEQWNQVKGAN